MDHKVSRLHMIIFMQKDLKVSMEFYKKLGFMVGFFVPEKWCELKIGDIKIGLCPIEYKDFEGPHSGVVFEIKDLKNSYEFFKNEGITFANELVDAEHGYMITCVDPSGNMFDLYEPKAINFPKSCKESCSKNDDLGCCAKETTRSGCC